MPEERNHTALVRWILKIFFKIDLDALTSEQRASLTQLHDARVERQQLHDVVEAKETEIGSLKRQLDNAEKAADAYKHQLESSETNLSSVKKQRDQLDERHKKLQNDLDAFKQERLALQSQASDYERQIKELKTAIKQKEKELADARTDSDEIDQLKQQLSAATSAKTELENKVAELDADIKALNQDVASRDRKIEGLEAADKTNKKHLDEAVDQNDQLQQQLTAANEEKKQLYDRLAQLEEAQHDDPHDDGEDENQAIEDEVLDSKTINNLVDQLSAKGLEIQRLNETIDTLNDEKQALQAKIDSLEKKYNTDIATLTAQLIEKEKTIYQQAETIRQIQSRLALLERSEELLHVDAKETDEDEDDWDTGDDFGSSDSDATHGNDEAATGKQPKVKNKVNDVTSTSSSEDDNIAVDLPSIEADGSIVTKRTIEVVRNMQTGEFIKADQFFQLPKSEISSMSRKLEIISRCGGQPLLVCAKCHQPVKISKITTLHGETQFFTHCNRDVECEWKTTSQSNEVPEPDIILDESTIEENTVSNGRYDKLKALIHDTLMRQKESGDDIEDVKVDYKLRSTNGRRRWRLYDVYVRWHGIDIVFKLQRCSDYLQDLVSHDEFCKARKCYIIWVFGSDSASDYNYLLEHNYQNTLFDNHSCVFILDHDAEKACKESDELKLKCNWLEDGENWHYTLKKTNSNGILVSLMDLAFDDEDTYKPYYLGGVTKSTFVYDEIAPLKPGVFKYRIGLKWGIYNSNLGITSECKYSDISFVGKKGIKAQINDFIKLRSGFLSDSGEEIPSCKNEIAPGRYIVSIFQNWCIINEQNEPITPFYDHIHRWCDNRLIVEKDDLYGIIDYQGNDIAGFKFNSVRIVSDDKLEVTDHIGSYCIDTDANIIYMEIMSLQDGISKVRGVKKWGMMNVEGKLIVDGKYDEIATFRKRIYGFINKSLIKLETAPRYNYRIKFMAEYVGKVPGNYVFTCNGVKMLMRDDKQNHADREKGKKYEVFLSNIERKDGVHETYTIAAANDATNSMPFDHIDSDSDFKVGEQLKGKVYKIKKLKNGSSRLYVRFSDGRQTYVSSRRIARAGIDPNKLKKGSTINLEKVDFDKYYEVTKWNVIK